MWDNVPHVPQIAPVDRTRFEGEIYSAGQPVVLKGQAADWPIVALAGAPDRAFCDYLTGRANPSPVQLWVGPPGQGGRYGFSGDYASENFDRRLAPMAQICDFLLRAADEPDAPAMFAGAINLPEHMPALLPDVPMALLAPARDRLTSLWLGTPSRTAAHWDLAENLSCVVRGQRRYLLFPPQQIGNLYLGPIDRTLAGQSISLVDCEAPDFARFPKFAEAMAHAEQAILEPGDVLFIPSMWFHHVASDAPIGAQINFWWRANNAETLSPLASLHHALLTLRDLPDGERAAWGAFFQHYIFGPRDAATAHLPEGAHGLLGPMGLAQQLQLSERLVNELAGWHNMRLKSGDT